LYIPTGGGSTYLILSYRGLDCASTIYLIFKLPCRLQIVPTTPLLQTTQKPDMRGKKHAASAAATKTKLSGGGKAYDPDAPFTARDVWQMATTALIASLLGRYALLPLLEWYRDSRSSGTESCAS
jgi:hypothetical protein